ncbi:MAG: helix-turn-helix transcriptional regulator [Synergistaceae bacterium]|nr:helix-turn-helix transcriptional regulator [Synergistaceae bacterium]
MSNNSLGKRLAAIRLHMGLTTRQAGEMIGVCAATIHNFELDSTCVRHPPTLRKIISFINEHSQGNSEFWNESPEQKNSELHALEKKIFTSFISGKKYCIVETGNSVNPREDWLNPTTGKGCIFIYERKEGKHHMFREERGGWTRTYTDNQLIGKHVKEVTL